MMELTPKQKETFDIVFGMSDSRKKMYAAVEAVLALDRTQPQQAEPDGIADLLWPVTEEMRDKPHNYCVEQAFRRGEASGIEQGLKEAADLFDGLSFGPYYHPTTRIREYAAKRFTPAAQVDPLVAGVQNIINNAVLDDEPVDAEEIVVYIRANWRSQQVGAF